MKILTLKRFCYAPFGTYGRMDVDGRTMYTVEPRWQRNERNVSCIPEGVYALSMDPWRDALDAPLIMNVPGRSQIQIHPANVPSQLEGCIAVGWSPGYHRGQWAVLQSKAAFDYLMARWPFVQINITNEFPEDVRGFNFQPLSDLV